MSGTVGNFESKLTDEHFFFFLLNFLVERKNLPWLKDRRAGEMFAGYN